MGLHYTWPQHEVLLNKNLQLPRIFLPPYVPHFVLNTNFKIVNINDFVLKNYKKI